MSKAQRFSVRAPAAMLKERPLAFGSNPDILLKFPGDAQPGTGAAHKRGRPAQARLPGEGMATSGAGTVKSASGATSYLYLASISQTAVWTSR